MHAVLRHQLLQLLLLKRLLAVMKDCVEHNNDNGEDGVKHQDLRCDEIFDIKIQEKKDRLFEFAA
jgi:hypothetical protein